MTSVSVTPPQSGFAVSKMCMVSWQSVGSGPSQGKLTVDVGTTVGQSQRLEMVESRAQAFTGNVGQMKPVVVIVGQGRPSNACARVKLEKVS